jgi:hypothetical protein
MKAAYGSRQQYDYSESCSGGINIHGVALLCFFSCRIIEIEVQWIFYALLGHLPFF